MSFVAVMFVLSYGSLYNMDTENTINLRDVIYANYPLIVGYILLLWYAVYLLLAWTIGQLLWRREGSQNVAQRCPVQMKRMEGEGTLCWLRTVRGWEIHTALSTA
jgi:hypothetical protein